MLHPAITNRVRIWIMICCLLAALGCQATFSAGAIAAESPRQCLTDISQAMANGDTDAFERLIALDPILEASLDLFLKEAAKPENASALPPMLALMFTQNAGPAGQAVRGMLLGTARAFILGGVSSGAFVGKKLDAKQSQSLLSPLFAHASVGRKEIRNIGEAVPDNDDWLLPFTVRDHGNGQDYPLIGRFKNGDSGVYLAAIENLDQIFAQIQKEASGL